MQAKTDINELFFPVLTRMVFTQIEDYENPVQIPGKMALINGISKLPISIVSHDYRIILNKEAYNYGLNCLKTLFDLEQNDEIVFINSIMPKTLSFCHMDLTCPKKSFELRKDKFIPFVRVTNSYNSTFKLGFRVGVCRAICENGVIFGEDSIRFSFVHSKSNKEEINFEIKKDELKRILDKFKSDIEVLIENEIDKNYAFSLFCKGIGINFREGEKGKKRRNNVQAEFNPVFDKYCTELGDNFYALYNSITELSTNGMEADKMPVTRIHGRQSRAGGWQREVASLLRNKKFEYKEYLGGYLDLSKN